MRARPLVLLLLLTFAPFAMAVDLAPLWDFGKPEVSEQRFRSALTTASGDDTLILETQIARTYGLRRDFAAARQLLDALQPRLAGAGPEVRARHALELGRTLVSGAHDPDSLTAESRAAARAAYTQALDIAKGARLDDLVIDALHMFAFVDTAPDDQLRWGREALAVVEASTQPAAKKWEASLRNNIGYALHQLGRHDEALAEFRAAVELRERAGNGGATRAAHWMVAWTLRSLGRGEEALAIQLRLEREGDATGQPDPEVFDELEQLYRAAGDTARADRYAARKKALAP